MLEIFIQRAPLHGHGSESIMGRETKYRKGLCVRNTICGLSILRKVAPHAEPG